MSGKRILVLTSAHLCRNPRVVKEATTLGQLGYDVTVMSISSQERFERMDQTLMRGLPFKRVTIDYTATSARTRMANFLQRGATWAARQLCSKFKIETAQTLGPAAALLRLARRFPSDLVIAHTEIPIWAAQHLISDGRRVAVDVEDWYSEDLLYADRQSRPINLLRTAEQFTLRHAVYSSATSTTMANALVAAYQCPKPIVIRNSFPLQPTSRADETTVAIEPRFIWFSQTIGPGRGLEMFFAAWIRTKNPSQVYLLGDERPGYRNKLLSRIPAHRRGDLHFIPLVPPEELPSTLSKFDVGLALEPSRPLNRNITITNKILQYMNAGLAIVASDTEGQREVMQAAPDCGVVITAHETTEYAEKLDTLIGDRIKLRASQLAARNAAEKEFCWERETPRLQAAVEGALQ